MSDIQCCHDEGIVTMKVFLISHSQSQSSDDHFVFILLWGGPCLLVPTLYIVIVHYIEYGSKPPRTRAKLYIAINSYVMDKCYNYTWNEKCLLSKLPHL